MNLLATVAALTLSAAAPKEDAMTQRFIDTLWPKPSEVCFRPTTLQEREAFTKLIPALLTEAKAGGSASKSIKDLAASAGFLLDEWKEASETFWTLRERPGHFHGAGAYVFRTGPAADIVIQAPHADFDVGTGTLGVLLFLRPPADQKPRAFITNTAHRYKSRPGEKKEDEDHPADVAHNPDHLFQITTDLLAQGMSGLRVVQLHGFGKSEVQDRDTLTAVVSAGSKSPTPWVKAVAAALQGELGEGVRLYPAQTKVLGGTTNAQAKLLRSYPSARFLHLELSSDARKQLVTPERLQAFARALLETTDH